MKDPNKPNWVLEDKMNFKIINLNLIFFMVLLQGLGFCGSEPPTFRDNSGFSHTCFAPNIKTHQKVAVVAKYTGGGYFYARFTHDPNGNPIILFNESREEGIPATVRRFFYYTECSHLKVSTLNDVEAYCQALREMRINGMISNSEENIIKKYFERYSMSRNNPKATASLWKDVLSKCPEFD